MTKCGVVYLHEIKSYGLPRDEVSQAGKSFLIHDHTIIPARPVPSYPVKKGQPCAWQTVTGDYVFGVTHWVECSIPLTDLEQVKDAAAKQHGE